MTKAGHVAMGVPEHDDMLVALLSQHLGSMCSLQDSDPEAYDSPSQVAKMTASDR